MTDETLEDELRGIARRTGSVDRVAIAFKRKCDGEDEFVTPAALEAAKEAAMRAQEAEAA